MRKVIKVGSREKVELNMFMGVENIIYKFWRNLWDFI